MMNTALESKLEKSKEIRDKLAKEGKYKFPIGWENVKRAMIHNHNEQERCKEKFAEDKKIRDNEPIPKKLGRNDPCYCGSGKKYKKCCIFHQN